jgi:hypothetical protein
LARADADCRDRSPAEAAPDAAVTLIKTARDEPGDHDALPCHPAQLQSAIVWLVAVDRHGVQMNFMTMLRAAAGFDGAHKSFGIISNEQ